MRSFHNSANIQYSLDLLSQGRILPGLGRFKSYRASVYFQGRGDLNDIWFQLRKLLALILSLDLYIVSLTKQLEISLFTQKINSLYNTPRKLCLWVGILFSRCPSVHPSGRNVLFP